jgi:hypothetical protein
MADLKQIANMLAGYSAGSTGQLPAFVQNQQRQQMMDQEQQQRQQISAEERMNTYFTDAAIGLDLINQGNIDGFLQLGAQRLQLLQNFPDADPSDTQILMQLGAAAKNGSREALEHLKGELQTAVTIGKGRGVIKTPQAEIIPASSMVNGQITQRMPDGSFQTQTPAGFQQPVAEGYAMITPQEAAQLGLPTDRPFQRNSATGQISQIGGSGTTVNVNQGAEQSPGQKRLDEMYAEEYYNWTSGGGADTMANIASIGTVLGQIERGDRLTGPTIGLAPDWVNALTNPEALDAKQRVEEVVQRNLRVLLGAQFTEREGERLIARAFDARLGAKENAARLRKLMTQMSTAAEQKERMSRYFEENGTLTGYRGPRPSVNDFYSAISGVRMGEVVDGYRYNGGDPGSPESWVKQ